MGSRGRKGGGKAGRGQGGHGPGDLCLYGRHAVEAALGNPGREKELLLASPKALAGLKKSGIALGSLSIEEAEPAQLEALAGLDAPHQGLVLKVRPLPGRHIEDLEPDPNRPHNIVVVLDHLTDPHNVGAIFRSAAAFKARAIVTTTDRAASETGALAKAASGALEVVPWVRVTNLARGLDGLADLGYWRVGLDGEAEKSLQDTDAGRDVALILGAEGRGLRDGTKNKCDFLARLPVSDAVESLNVSVAAAVALYELVRGD